MTLAGLEVAIPGQPPPGSTYDPNSRDPGIVPTTDASGDVTFASIVPNGIPVGVQTLTVNFAGSGDQSTTVTIKEQAKLAPRASEVNGGFETGDFTGWTVLDEGVGGWFVYSGTGGPLTGAPVSAPPQGTFAATTDQTGPGSHILYQDIVLEPEFSHNLTFTLYYENDAGVFFTPPSLNHIGESNQQYRIDIMDPTAPVTGSVVLANVFQTNVGDPTSLEPTTVNFDLTPFAGQTIRLRFAQVDNQFFFRASVDAVKIDSVATDICTLTLSPSYADGTLTVNALVGTLVPAVVNLWGTAQSNIIPIVTARPLLVTDPPIPQSISRPVPPRGVVGLLATMTTPEDGIICSAFETVDTGSVP